MPTRKDFVCLDIPRAAPWKYERIRNRFIKHIQNRTTYRLAMFPHIQPDKKTRQWWAKFCNDPSFYNAHMYAHHLARQLLDIVARIGIDAFPDYTHYDILMYKRLTSECQWTPTATQAG